MKLYEIDAAPPEVNVEAVREAAHEMLSAKQGAEELLSRSDGFEERDEFLAATLYSEWDRERRRITRDLRRLLKQELEYAYGIQSEKAPFRDTRHGLRSVLLGHDSAGQDIAEILYAATIPIECRDAIRSEMDCITEHRARISEAENRKSAASSSGDYVIVRAMGRTIEIEQNRIEQRLIPELEQRINLAYGYDEEEPF